MMDALPISNMEWFANLLPDGSDLYWAILCTALAVLNVWQFALAHKMLGRLEQMFEHGHAPEGTVIVPAASVAPPPAAQPPGWTDPAVPQFILPPAQPVAKRPWEK